MRVTPIADEKLWEGAERIVLGPPAGEDPTGPVRAVEAAVDYIALSEDASHPLPRFNLRVQLEDGDLEALRENPELWVSFICYQMPPMQVGLLPEGIERAS